MDLQHVNDLEHLRSIATVQQAQIRHLIEALRQKCKELETFKGDGELQRTLAFLQELESKARPQVESTDPEPDGEHAQREKRTPQRGHGPTKQPALLHIVATHRLPEEQRGCSACGGTLEELEGQFETSETIDVVDVEYRVIQQRRQKYVCRCGGHVKTAPAPEPAVCGGRYSVAFAVKVAVDKYLHHLPLARQVRMMGLRGLEVRSQTLWDQVQEIGEKLEPSWEALLRRALSHGVIGVDQTAGRTSSARSTRSGRCGASPRRT
jgi:transposase